VGGTGMVFEGRPLNVEGEAEMVKKFQHQRAGDYQRLQAELRALARRPTREDATTESTARWYRRFRRCAHAFRKS